MPIYFDLYSASHRCLHISIYIYVMRVRTRFTLILLIIVVIIAISLRSDGNNWLLVAAARVAVLY